MLSDALPRFDQLGPPTFSSLRPGGSDGAEQACYWQLLPEPRSAEEVWQERVEGIRSQPATQGFHCRDLVAQTASFEDAAEVLDLLRGRSEANVLDVRASGWQEEEDLLRFFDAFCEQWLKGLTPEGTPSEPFAAFLPSSKGQSPPSLLELAAAAFVQTGDEGEEAEQRAPPHLRWYLKAKREESCSASRLRWAFMLELITTNDDGEDKTNAPSASASSPSFYSEEEQQSRHHCWFTFQPARPCCSYDISGPLEDCSHVGPWAAALDKALGVSMDFSRCEQGGWFFSSGSAGGTFTQHKSSSCNSGSKKGFTWTQVQRVRDAVKVFLQECNKKKATKREGQKQVVVAHVMAGGERNMALLDLRAQALDKEALFPLENESTGKLHWEKRCWFNVSAIKQDEKKKRKDDANDAQSTLDLEAMQKAMDKLIRGTVWFAVTVDLPAINPSREQELKAHLSGLYDGANVGKEEASNEGDIEKEKPEKKGLLGSCFFYGRDWPKVWEQSSSGTYACLLVVQKQPGKQKPSWNWRLGCWGCCGMLYYRPSNDFGKPHISNSLCPLHKALLIHNSTSSLVANSKNNKKKKTAMESNNAQSSLPLSTNALRSALLAVNLDEGMYALSEATPKVLASGLVDPEAFSTMFAGLRCGGILSRCYCWPEKSINEMMTEE
ncbi:hypothetical protein QOT17_005970 [Balamuthia mandrillaris]